jgi:TrmH RNA methyltransferase
MRRVVVLEEQEEPFGHVLRWCEKRDIHTKVVEFEELSRIAGTDHHEGVCIEAKPLPLMAAGALIKQMAEMQRGLLVVLEGVENPHNVGAILRTCCFFGVKSVIIQSNHISTLSAAACRIAEGAAEKMSIAIVKEYARAFAPLKAKGYSVVATTPHEAKSLYSVKWPDKTILFFGAEGEGLSPEVLAAANIRVAVPRLGPLESLNVGAAVSAVLTEARREAVVEGIIAAKSSAA